MRLADYYHCHLKRIIVAAASATTIAAIIGALIMVGFGIAAVYIICFSVLLWIVIGLCLATILYLALEPLNVLTRAITHISPQANDVVPPDINQERFEKTGLKAMVQTLYELSAGMNKPTPTASLPDNLIEMLPCGVIALSEAGDIIYANRRAPVVSHANNTRSIQLLFGSDMPLEKWMSEVAETKMTADKLWQAIASKPADDEGRKVYDVYADYQKGRSGGAETIIVTFDRTGEYGTSEESLDFISVAAHELRGPITVIRGYLDVLMQELKPSLQGDQIELINRLDVSAARLSGYVSNILNVAKFDHQHLKLHLQEERFKDIYKTIADDLSLRAKTQNRLLSVTIPDDLPTIAADRNSLGEVIANLVDNALKYSYEGGQVMVSAAVEGDFVKCTVKDFGVGMPMPVMAHIFKKFYRSHRSRSSVVGTGLGLYISKAIVESHGGRVGVASRENQGATFTFTVPIYATVAQKLMADNNENEAIIKSASGWIRNHSKIEG